MVGKIQKPLAYTKWANSHNNEQVKVTRFEVPGTDENGSVAFAVNKNGSHVGLKALCSVYAG